MQGMTPEHTLFPPWNYPSHTDTLGLVSRPFCPYRTIRASCCVFLISSTSDVTFERPLRVDRVDEADTHTTSNIFEVWKTLTPEKKTLWYATRTHIALVFWPCSNKGLPHFSNDDQKSKTLQFCFKRDFSMVLSEYFLANLELQNGNLNNKCLEMNI